LEEFSPFHESENKTGKGTILARTGIHRFSEEENTTQSNRRKRRSETG